MSGKTQKAAIDFKKEKNKWILVAVLSVILVLVYVFYFKKASSVDGHKDLIVQNKKVEVLDNDILSALPTELKPSLPMVHVNDQVNNDIIPLVVKDIFSFGLQKDIQKEMTEELPIEKEGFILKGTLMDGNNSLAFLNDQVLGIGDRFNGFTVVQITDDKAVIRNGEKEITLLIEDPIDEAF